MDKKLTKVVAGFFIMMLVLTLFTSFTATLTVPIVQVKKPSASKLTHTVTAEGTIEPIQYRDVFGEKGFTLEKIHVKEGEYVEKGTVLFSLKYAEIEKLYKTESLKLKKLKLMERHEVSEPIDPQSIKRADRALKDYELFKEESKEKLLKAEEEVKEAEQIFYTFLVDYKENNQFQVLLECSPEQISLVEHYMTAKQELSEVKLRYEKLEKEKEKNKVERDYELEQARIFDFWRYLMLLDKYRLEEEEERVAIKEAKNTYDQSKKVRDELSRQIKELEFLSPFLKADYDKQYSYLKDVLAQYSLYKKEHEAKQKAYEDLQQQYEIALLEKERDIEDAQLVLESYDLEEEKRLISAEHEEELLQIDIAMQQLTLETLEALYKQKGIFKAETSGYITSINMKEGEICSQTSVMTLSQPEEGYQFVCEVNEAEKEFISVGDELTLTSKKGEKITEGIPVSEVRRSKANEERYEIVAYLEEDLEAYTDRTLKMKAASKTDAFKLCVPLSALNFDGQYYVFVMKETEGILGKQMSAMRIDVTVLDKTDKIAAIEGPVTKEDEVIITSSKAINDGDRVRLGL